MKISFCTTCMGRAPHLRQTLAQNIADNLPRVETDDPQVEFVVLNYGSRDNLHEWITGDPEMQDYMKRGILKYARYEDPKFFNPPHAKNMAHRLATGTVVCNLDADNFTGKAFAALVADRFEAEPKTVMHAAMGLIHQLPQEEQGSIGRLILPHDDFMRMGGYDEERYATSWGGNDTDLLLRAFAYGLKSSQIDDLGHLRTISHGHEARVCNLPEGEKANDMDRQARAGLTLEKIERRLKMMFGLAQSNRTGHFGEGSVAIGGSDEKIAFGPVDLKRDFVLRTSGVPAYARIWHGGNKPVDENRETRGSIAGHRTNYEFERAGPK